MIETLSDDLFFKCGFTVFESNEYMIIRYTYVL